MKKVFLAILLSLSARSAFTQTTVTFSTGDVAKSMSLKPAATISPDSLLKHIKFLASDSLEGRGSGEPGNNLAASYIAGYFKSLGLKSFSAAQTVQSYFQKFEITTGLRAGMKNALTVGKKKNTSPETLVPLGISASAEVTSEAVVFVGYGITTKDGKYNDYANVDVKGKIAVMMRFSPDGNNPHSDFYDYAALRYKINTARDNGATGVIIFTGKENDEDDKLVKLSSENLSTDAGIPVLNISRPLAAAVLRKSEAELAAVQKSIDQSKSPKSFVIQNSIAFETEVIKERKPTQNVIAYLEGNDPKLKDEFVVIGGHYDHLGYGGNGSGSLAPDQKKIHYGADDNASGTAGVLEAARYFTSHKDDLKRSVIFMCFSGEEMGLLGSAYFTAHPVVPLEKITAMLNMDMIGRMKDSSLSVGGAGTAQGMRDICNKLNTQGFKLKLTDDGYGPSDHASFYVKDIPVLFFFTGNHANYHKPTDTWDKINSAGEAMVVNYVCALAVEFVSQAERLTFTKAKSNGSSGSMASGASGGFRVSLGTIPNYAEEVEGVKLDGVREGSVAEKSGIKGGDIIIGFGAQTIRSIYDYTDAIRAAKPGDEVKITVLRGKEKLELIARFPDKAAANVRQ